MHRYVIERTLPGAGKLTAAQLHDISTKSCDVLRTMGKDIQWARSCSGTASALVRPASR